MIHDKKIQLRRGCTWQNKKCNVVLRVPQNAQSMNDRKSGQNACNTSLSNKKKNQA